MREGFTTGSCAAAAAKAAAYMLLSGRAKERITIQTPAGKRFTAELKNVERKSGLVRCAVEKDGGDDPDITTGALVFAAVSVLKGQGKPGAESTESGFGAGSHRGRVIIEGGDGVGRVTKPGLDQPVGNAAINSVPRQMIEGEVREVAELFDYSGDLFVEISVPGGRELAEKTFNPRLGIHGGISILGTTGVVEPMSTQAVLDTIRVELTQKKALGVKKPVIAPGSYGFEFMKEYGYDLELAVKCSNYIGDTLDMIGELGFPEVLLIGHIGKLIKLSGGIMNTHSRVADCRMELMAAAGLEAGIRAEVLRRLLTCVSTDAAYALILEEGKEKEFMRVVMKRIQMHLNKRAAGRFSVECIVFSNVYGVLGETAGN